jgi:hypothetical protein
MLVLAVLVGRACRGDGPHGDASTDAGRDAASPDGGESHDDANVSPGWRAVEGFDSRCAVEVAEIPSSAVPSLAEAPCSDAAGCRELSFPPHDDVTVSVRIEYVVGGARWDPTTDRGHFWWYLIDNTISRWSYALSDSDGITHQAISMNTGNLCYVSAQGAGSGHFGLELHVITDPGGASIGGGTIEDSLSFRHFATISEADMPGQHVQYMPVDGDTMAPNTTGGAQMWRVGADRAATRLAWGGDAEHYISDIHEGTIFTTEIGVRNHVAISVGGGAIEPFIVPKDGSDSFGLRTDGANLVWRQGYDRIDVTQYGRVEIWTAPYTTDVTALAPRRVADAGLAGVHAGHDFYGNAIVDPDPSFEYVVRFLDGRPARRIRNPPERSLGILFAGPEEVALLMYRVVPRVETVRFYRYDALSLAE